MSIETDLRELWPNASRKAQRVLGAFFSGWTADRMLMRWDECIRAAGADPSPHIIRTHAQMFGPSVRTTWWSRQKLQARTELIQRACEKAASEKYWCGPGIWNSWERRWPSGVNTTAYELRMAGDNAIRSGAVLIAASMRRGAEALCPQAPSWHTAHCIIPYLKQHFSPDDDWHHAVKETLPYVEMPPDEPHAHWEGFIDRLAAEHAEILRKYVPVSLESIDALNADDSDDDEPWSEGWGR